MDLRRTDLAMEARELWQERAGQTAQLPGVRAEERKRAGMPVTVVQVLDERGEQALGKPRGTYVTLTLEGVETRADGAFPRAVEAVAAELGELLEQIDLKKGPVLVAGLGNRAITPDAIGPRVHDCTLVTAPGGVGVGGGDGQHGAGESGTGGLCLPKHPALLRHRGGRPGLPQLRPAVPHGAAGGHGHLPRLRRGQPPGGPG